MIYRAVIILPVLIVLIFVQISLLHHIQMSKNLQSLFNLNKSPLIHWNKIYLTTCEVTQKSWKALLIYMYYLHSLMWMVEWVRDCWDLFSFGLFFEQCNHVFLSLVLCILCHVQTHVRAGWFESMITCMVEKCSQTL